MARAIYEAAKVRGKRAPRLLMVSNGHFKGLAVVRTEAWIEIKTSIGMNADSVHIFLAFGDCHNDLIQIEFEKRNCIGSNTQEKALTSPKKSIKSELFPRGKVVDCEKWSEEADVFACSHARSGQPLLGSDFVVQP
jgi:hypothetical protein